MKNLNFSTSLPYSKEGSLIKITNDQKLILSVDVSQFMDHCGNSICEFGENIQNCPNDCANAQSKNEENGSKIQLNSKITPTFYYLSFLPVIIIILILGFYFMRFKIYGKRRTKADLRNYITDNLKKGYGKEQIKNALIKNNYNPQEIDEGFKELR